MAFMDEYLVGQSGERETRHKERESANKHWESMENGTKKMFFT